MPEAPDTIEGAVVFCHAFTSKLESVAALAICRYPKDDAFYLFACDPEWNCIDASQLATFDDAQLEAERNWPEVRDMWMHGTMPLHKRGLIERVREAFKGVQLGNGVGLWEASAIDDYLDEATRKAYRAEDESMDWEAIPAEKLYDTLCFMDAEGMRFHIPAFMVMELEGKRGLGGIANHFTNLDSAYGREKFALFSPQQRSVVRNYLLLVVYTRNCMFGRADIEKALREYWTPREGETPYPP